MIGEIFPLIGTTKQVVIDQNAEVVCGAIGVGESSFLGSLSPELREIGIQSFIAVPVKANNETTGILQIHSLERDIYEDQHVRLLRAIADQIAGAIANSQLYARVAQSEKSLRNSENKLRALFESTASGILTIDNQGVIESLNPAAE